MWPKTTVPVVECLKLHCTLVFNSLRFCCVSAGHFEEFVLVSEVVLVRLWSLVSTYNFIGRSNYGLIGLGRFTSCSVRYAAGKFTWLVVSLMRSVVNVPFWAVVF